MEDFAGNSSFNYLAEDHMLSNFCQLAENISNALSKNADTTAITDQVKRLKQTKEKWPDKIFQTWLNRVIPVFTQESIYKLIQSYLSWIEEVNESRKRQREALKVDNVDLQRIKQLDTYQALVLTTEAKMHFLPTWTQGYVELELELNANYNAFQQSHLCLQDHEQGIRENLHALEQDLIPIRYLSTQSNVKSSVIKNKTTYLAGSLILTPM